MSLRSEFDSMLPLGKSEVRISPIGLGAWQWGDRWFWSYGSTHQRRDVRQAFDASRQAGVNWVDTAEVYSNGTSERLLGEFLRQSPGPVVLATKFMPFPWRLRRQELLNALRHSLERIGVPRVDLYQIHQPLPPVAIRTWMQAMAEAHESGAGARGGRLQLQPEPDAGGGRGVGSAWPPAGLQPGALQPAGA